MRRRQRRRRSCQKPQREFIESRETYLAAWSAGGKRKMEEPYGMVFSARALGLTGLTQHDRGIGQLITRTDENVDNICSMLYPSHHATREYGIFGPDSEPYRTVFLSLRDAKERVKATGRQIRLWL